MNKLDFKNQNIVVTGGSSGIGEACVFRLVESGAKVIIWDKNVNQINKKLEDLISKNLVSIYSIDITRYEDILNIFNKIIKEYKKIDGLINSAGYAGKNTTVIDYPVDEWKKIHDINVNGTFFTNKVIASHMKNNNYGRIVNVASIADNGTGLTGVTYTNNMSVSSHAVTLADNGQTFTGSAGGINSNSNYGAAGNQKLTSRHGIDARAQTNSVTDKDDASTIVAGDLA